MNIASQRSQDPARTETCSTYSDHSWAFSGHLHWNKSIFRLASSFFIVLITANATLAAILIKMTGQIAPVG